MGGVNYSSSGAKYDDRLLEFGLRFFAIRKTCATPFVDIVVAVGAPADVG